MEVTVTVVLLEFSEICHKVLPSVRLATVMPCVTVIVRVGAPGAVTVILPVLLWFVKFCATLSVKDPLPAQGLA